LDEDRGVGRRDGRDRVEHPGERATPADELAVRRADLALEVVAAHAQPLEAPGELLVLERRAERRRDLARDRGEERHVVLGEAVLAATPDTERADRPLVEQDGDAHDARDPGRDEARDGVLALAAPLRAL